MDVFASIEIEHIVEKAHALHGVRRRMKKQDDEHQEEVTLEREMAVFIEKLDSEIKNEVFASRQAPIVPVVLADK